MEKENVIVNKPVVTEATEVETKIPNLIIKVKKLVEYAKLPAYAHDTDAGMDLTATSVEYKSDIDCYVYGTGLAVQIPEGYVGLLFPRSSNRKTDCYLTNHVGIIDSGYRGEIMLTFKNRSTLHDNAAFAPYKIKERVGQLIIIRYPIINFIESEELSPSERGENGHGSTGK